MPCLPAGREHGISQFINIYPNPCQEKCMLSNESTHKIRELYMYDNTGRLQTWQVRDLPGLSIIS